MRANFELEVIGGESVELEIILVNLLNTVKFNRESVYVGLKVCCSYSHIISINTFELPICPVLYIFKPWYEKYKGKFEATNQTEYLINLNVSENTPRFHNFLPRVAAGYMELITQKDMHLFEFETKNLKIEGMMGFNEEFSRELRVVVNDSSTKILHIRGHGVMPLLMVTDRNIPALFRDQADIELEYLFLQRIYYFEIFKGITVEEPEDLFTPMAEEHTITKKSIIMTPTLSEDTSGSQTSSSNTQDDLIFFRVVQTYVFVYNNQDMPNISVLEQLLETERFLTLLRIEKERCMLLNTVYQNYLQTRNFFKDKVHHNIKYFTVQPLPFQTRSRLLDIGQLHLNEYRKITLKLEFSGPGRFIASVRSAVYIPGLVVDLELIDSRYKIHLYYPL